MPAASPQELVDALLRAFQESGGSAVSVSSIRRNPRRFLVQTGQESTGVWAYIWTLTPGGRPNLPDEYRIQMTTVESPLPTNPSGNTLLLGYERDTEVFAGFDLAVHRRFTAGSSSVQIGLACIHQALQDGLAFDRKTNQEIAVAVRADQLLNYMANAVDIHRHGKNATMHRLLAQASALKGIRKKELIPLSPKRQRIVSSVQRWARLASFRQQVLCAYDNRCAVTRMQLRLVEAAHILPVYARGSTDRVENGIALSPTYHRAFDKGLIYLDENYAMRINAQQERHLAKLELDAGIGAFKAALGRTIHLPHDKQQQPDVGMIRKANGLRRIPV